MRYGSTVHRRNKYAKRVPVQLRQFVICLAVFLAVFIGKGVFPEKTEQLKAGAWSLLTEDMDLREALTHLGMGDHSRGAGQLLNFCRSVFGPAAHTSVPVCAVIEDVHPASSMETELEFLSSHPSPAALSHHYLNREGVIVPDSPVTEAYVPAPQEDAVPAGVVLEYADCTGEQPPDDCTMNRISLGSLKTMTPVLGQISSPFGYRTHPIDGTHKFHAGLDIAAETGTPIYAFADGTVEFIGEGESFGQYIQIDHGNNVKSLYAHCSKLCASKGDKVFMGDQIALVGETGEATGPHLHLELKYGDTRLNPAYYVGFTGQS